MKGKAILLATIMVVSMAVAGIGGASAASTADSVQVSTQQPVQLQENTTNATPQASGDDGDDLPEGIDVPPSELKNATLDRSSIPSNVAGENGGTYSVSSKDKASAASITGAAYNPNPKQLTWFGYDGTGQAGTYYFKDYTLRAVGPHVEVWVANNLSWPKGDDRPTPEVTDQQAAYLADQFESNIYPNETRLFRKPTFRNGSGASLYGPPGPNGTLPDGYYETSDNTSRTVLLVDNIRDKNYYNSSYPVYTAGLHSPTINDYTDRNVAFIDAANWDRRLGGPDAPWKPNDGDTRNYSVEGTTAHEYQHVLHGAVDPDETTWINEGFSDFAIYATGYGLDKGHINAYSSHPENSLVKWGDQGQVNILRDYGGALLFQLYTNQRYGTEFTKSLFNNPDNGIKSVNEALDDVGANENFYEVYQDFQTMLVTDGTDAPGEYQLDVTDLDVNTQKDDSRTRANLTAAYGNAYNPVDPKSGSVDSLTVSGTDFTSTPWSSVEDPTGDSDHQVLYSGKGNDLDNFAIFNADLSGTDSPTLSFDTYYDIEPGYDYAFVQVSTDGGDTWTSLENENTTSYRHEFINPTAEANLPGFTNSTNGEWVNEQFDLSEYAGQDVLIAFRYVTDPASAYPGFYVRDISVSGTDINYSGASTEPFQSLREVQQNYLRYEFSLIGIDDDGSTEVQQYDPTEFKNGSKSFGALLDGKYDHTYLAASWAPETGEGGTVPYGYSVNVDDGSSDDKNTLTIHGSGTYSFYAFRVGGDITDSDSLTGEDSVSGASVSGAVGGGSDTYTFSGDLQNLYVAEGATVTLNGERIDPDDYESVLRVEGTGKYSSYDFTVQDGTITDTDSLTKEDSVSGHSVSGAVAGGSDEYTFTGSMRGLDIDGDAHLVLNGMEVSPSVFYNTITFEGTGSLITYEFTVSGEITDTQSLTNEDSASGSHAKGAVRNGADTYVYSGIITDLSYSTTNSKATVTRNGERISENDV